MTQQNPASPDGEYVNVPREPTQAMLNAAYTVCHVGLDDNAYERIYKAMIKAALASAPRPDADAKLAEIRKRHVNEDRNGCELGTVEAYCQTHNDRACLLSTASEALQECERLRAALVEIREGKGRYSQNKFEHACNTIEDMKEIARRALGAAK